jgi:hypothetical protein
VGIFGQLFLFGSSPSREDPASFHLEAPSLLDPGVISVKSTDEKDHQGIHQRFSCTRPEKPFATHTPLFHWPEYGYEYGASYSKGAWEMWYSDVPGERGQDLLRIQSPLP